MEDVSLNDSKRLILDAEEPRKRQKTDSEDVIENGSKPRRRTKKFALLLSYCGKNYLGMQRNPGFKTIEDELLNAMLKAYLISEEVCTCPQICRFQRAARTDKGVSAARQVISMKLPDDVDLPEALNAFLPDEIRVLKAVRVTQKFDSKMQCDSRTYSYMTPTFAFAPSLEETNEDYRMTAETLENLNSILSTYKGTHRFHNFTARVKANEDRAKRFIMNIECGDPFVRDEIEWVVIKITGQSFMLHQIRKMVGLAMAISKGLVTKDVFIKAWRPAKCDIPIAPGLGLVLEEPHYNYYNKKFGDDGMHEKLDWSSLKNTIEDFKRKYIESVIINAEKEEKVTHNWLKTLPMHTFDTREHDKIQMEEAEKELTFNSVEESSDDSPIPILCDKTKDS